MQMRFLAHLLKMAEAQLTYIRRSDASTLARIAECLRNGIEMAEAEVQRLEHNGRARGAGA